MTTTLSPDLLRRLHAWWRAANYLSVGQIYLRANPLLEVPLNLAHIKPRLLGHWGTTPGLNFVYVHLNRLIKDHDLNMINIIGPGHGGPGLVASTYLEGSYSETYPAVSQDRDGMDYITLSLFTLSPLSYSFKFVTAPILSEIHEYELREKKNMDSRE